jgi:hypothetical protein
MNCSRYIPPRTKHTPAQDGDDHHKLFGKYRLSSDFSPEEIRELRVSLANSLYMLRRHLHFGPSRGGKPRRR